MSRAPSLLVCLVCALVAAGEEPVTITVSSIPTEREMAALVHVRATYEVIKAFERRHPDIRVRGFEGLRLDENTAAGESTMLLAIAGGTAPDIIVGSFRQARNYIEQGFFLPLDDYLDPAAQKASQDIPERMWTIVESGGRLHGLVDSYYLLMLIYRRDLFEEVGLDPDRPPRTWEELYRFSQRLTLPGKKLAREEGFLQPVGQKGFTLMKGILGGWMYTNFVWQAGGDMVRKVKHCPACGGEAAVPKEKDFISCPDCGTRYDNPAAFRWVATFDDAAGVRALQFYRQLAQSIWKRCPACAAENDAPHADCPTCGEAVYAESDADRVVCPVDGTAIPLPAEMRPWRCRKCGARLDYEELIDDGVARVEVSGEFVLGHALARGEVAMLIGPGISGEFVQAIRQAGLRSDQIGIATLPAGPSGRSVNLSGGTILGVNATQRDETVRRAAVRFVQFAVSEEAHRIRTRVYVESGWWQMATPNDLRRFGYEELYAQIPEHLRTAFDEIEANARLEPYNEKYQHVQTNLLAVPIDEALLRRSADPRALLRACANDINTRLFGSVPLEVMQRRRTIATVLVLAVAAVVLVAFARTMRVLARTYAVQRVGGLSLTAKQRSVAWLLMLPALASVFLWQYVPLLRGTAIAFLDYRIVGDSAFVWLDNFIRAFCNPEFYNVMLVSLYYVFLSLTLGFVAPIVLAIVLTEIPYGKIFFRTIYFLPMVTTGIIIMMIWRVIFDPSEHGVLNRLLLALGLEKQLWLGDTNLAMLCVVLVGMWAGTGPGCIIYLAALKCVPEELYESADLDGASILRKVRYVTLPTLLPLILINFLGAFIGAFHAMQNVFVLTGGGPSNATRVIGIDIFYQAFLFLDLGYATALAWILGSLLIGFTLYQLRILKQVDFRTAGEA